MTKSISAALPKPADDHEASSGRYYFHQIRETKERLKDPTPRSHLPMFGKAISVGYESPQIRKDQTAEITLGLEEGLATVTVRGLRRDGTERTVPVELIRFAATLPLEAPEPIDGFVVTMSEEGAALLEGLHGAEHIELPGSTAAQARDLAAICLVSLAGK